MSTNEISGIPKNWQAFIVSVLFVILLPLAPLLIEWWLDANGNVAAKSIVLTAVLYSISIAASSGSKLLFSIIVVGTVFMSISYGVTVSSGSPPPGGIVMAWTVVVIAGGIHCFERYNWHVAKAIDFLLARIHSGNGRSESATRRGAK